MYECCDNGCMECVDMVSGYINIYDIGGMYQSNSGIYAIEVDAIETGKMVKGYVATVPVKFKKKVA